MTRPPFAKAISRRPIPVRIAILVALCALLVAGGRANAQDVATPTAAFASQPTSGFPETATETTQTRIPVSLRDPLVVEGAQILLGDVFETYDITAAQRWKTIVLGQAPAPGQTQSFDPQWLQRKAFAHGLHWTPHASTRRVTVIAASQDISRDDLSHVIADELSQLRGGMWSVRLNMGEAIHAPIQAALAPRITNIDYDARTTRVTAQIELFPGANPLRVAGRAEPAMDYVVIAAPVRRGEALSPRHITWTTAPISAMPQGAVTDPGALIGHTAQRALRVNQALRETDLAPPLAVRRGEPATLLFQSGRLTLTSRARAMNDASVGQIARFTSLASGQVVEAWVHAPGVAIVSPHAAGQAPGHAATQPIRQATASHSATQYAQISPGY